FSIHPVRAQIYTLSLHDALPISRSNSNSRATISRSFFALERLSSNDSYRSTISSRAEAGTEELTAMDLLVTAKATSIWNCRQWHLRKGFTPFAESGEWLRLSPHRASPKVNTNLVADW